MFGRRIIPSFCRILVNLFWWNRRQEQNLTYGHHIYRDGYPFRGRPVGCWADQDAKILSFGSLLKKNGISFGGIIRTGDLNKDNCR